MFCRHTYKMVPPKWTFIFIVITAIIFSNTFGIELDENEEFITYLNIIDSTEEPENIKGFCVEVCGVGQGVECSGDITDRYKITCTCEHENEAFDEKEKKCKEDKCFTQCGISYTDKESDVKCSGGPFGNVKCGCKDYKQAFDPNNKECKTDYCKEKCGGETSAVKCDGNLFEESEVECLCKNDMQDFDEDVKKCKTNYCKKICGIGERIECEGDHYKPEITCTCDSDDYVYRNKKCIQKCYDDSDCEHGGVCSGKDDDSKICVCQAGTKGQRCESITACVTGKYKDCRGEKGECVFNKDKPEKAECRCQEGKALDETKGYCEASCVTDYDCKDNRKCNSNGFCVCRDGYEGEDCRVVIGCEKLEEMCAKIGTECIFDENNPGRGKCRCKDGYTYNRDKNECQDPYCYPSNPCKQAECRYDESLGTGYCYCSGVKYYDYGTQSCEDLPDKCLLKKTPCDENEMCVNGECKCQYPVKKDEECKRTCTSNYCFANARCSEYDGTCFCEEDKYFTGSKCENARCSLKDFDTTCSCPSGTRRLDEECVPIKDEDELCSKDCGYGVCVEKSGRETCKCFNSIADFISVPNFGEKCILKKKFCAGGQLQLDSMKCKCAGQYTQAEDGITCRLKTCNDDDVKAECDFKGGECIMDWKGKGYSCQCPKGYGIGDDGKCTDICSIGKVVRTCAKEDQLCYNSVTNDNNVIGNCICPPTIKRVNGKCSEIAENVYILRNILVLKKRYEIKSGINKALLSADLVQSMQTIFHTSLFEYGYLYDYRIVGDAINCSVWINLKENPVKAELEKIKLVPKTFPDLCFDCDDTAIIWPPNLILSDQGLQEVTIDKLKFCSNEVKDLLCGKGASCTDNRCTCKEGFKIVANSIREIGGYEIARCEDIDECALGISICSVNTTCVNTFGDYKCVCKERFKKKETFENPETDKNDCYDMCTPSPCKKGKCSLKDKTFDCQCEPGYGGALCDRLDENFVDSKKETVVVGSVLGVLVFILAVAFLYYFIKTKKQSHSGDFVPHPRKHHTEMTERRQMRGVNNPTYA